jgi:diaminopimelate decarboxylase
VSATQAGPLSGIWPQASAVNAAGRVEVGGCDLVELAAEVGTPAYVVAEDDLRARARAMREAFAARTDRFALFFATKAFPCTAVLRVFAEEGIGADVASGGELRLALAAGVDPADVVLHGNAKSEAELQMARDAGVRTIVLDNLDELERLVRVVGDGAPQEVLVRVTPGVRGATHDKISTGQADSKFGFGLDAAREAVARASAEPGLRLRGVHMHIGSQLLELEPFRRAVAAARTLGPAEVVNLGGGLGVPYTPEQHAPSFDEYAAAKVDAVREHFGPDAVVLDEPGRSLCGPAGVTIYRVETVKRNVRTWVAVDGGMADNLRPMLYGARYEAHVADRPGGGDACRLVGKHCESGDVLVAEARLADPRAGDVVVTPVTGAYGHALANTYNGVPRPPVVFVSGGRARTVVRRETLDDLVARDL